MKRGNKITAVEPIEVKYIPKLVEQTEQDSRNILITGVTPEIIRLLGELVSGHVPYDNVDITSEPNFTKNKYELGVVDVGTGAPEAIDFISQLKKQNAKVLAYTSAINNAQIYDKLEQAGADEILHEVFTVDSFIKSLDKLLIN